MRYCDNTRVELIQRQKSQHRKLKLEKKILHSAFPFSVQLSPLQNASFVFYKTLEEGGGH